MSAVAVCVATFRRPEGLTRVVRGLDRLAFGGEPPRIEIVVVDNDPGGAARATCDALRGTVRWPLRYVHEPTRGLSAVRNRAVAEARGADFVAFIDDDEEPTPAWLEALLRVQREYDADVVLGPTLRRVEGEVPAWIEKGRFFEEPRYATGTLLEHGGIGNSLIRASAFERLDPPFDARLGLAGGEDTHFFLRLHDVGGRIVWADDAVVHEWIPTSRANTRWILQRVYRTSITWGMCESELRPSRLTAALRVGKGALRITWGLASLPFTWVGGRHRAVRSLWWVFHGAGHVAGVAGLRYHEYRITHGR